MAVPLVAPRLGLGLLVLALVPLAAAQVADPSVSLALDATSLDLGAANTTTVNATVTNGNAQVGGNVVMSLVAPDGWTVVADPIQFPLAAGASQAVVLTITAPGAGLGAQAGDVALTATLTETLARGSAATSTQAIAVARVDPLPPPPPPPLPWHETAAGIGGVAVAAALVLAGVEVLLRRSRKAHEARLAAEAAAARAAYLDRETGITVAPLDGPSKYGHSREQAFRVQVQNVSARPRVALVDVAEWPDGWAAAVSIPRIELKPGERVSVAVYVNPAETIPAGTPARFVVAAKPEEALELDERVTLECDAPAVRIPLEGGLALSRAARINANQRIAKP